MSGIVGLLHLDGRTVEPSDLRRLTAASARPAPEVENHWIGSTAAIAYRYSPLTSPSGLAVAFDGRLDNRQELLDTCPISPSAPEAPFSDAALVLAAYGQFGEAFVNHLNGDFALALFDSVHQRLFLARDRMGARALYYCLLPGALIFSSEIKCLLAHPAVRARPDDDALADLVLEGYSDGSRTCFQDISGVPPGHVLVAAADRQVIRRHWDFDPARETRYRLPDDYVQEFRSRFAESVERRLRSAQPVAVAVSGGLDSSSIFCQARTLIAGGTVKAALSGLALTFPGDAAADEAAYLDQIEGATGLPVARQPVSALRLLAGAEEVVWHMEIPGLAWDAQSGLFACARRSGCEVILDGFFGDQVLFDRAYLVDLVRQGRWGTVRRHLREYALWMTDVEPGLFGRQLRSALVRALPPRWLFQFVKNRTARRRFLRHLPRWYTSSFLQRVIDRSLSRAQSDRQGASHHGEQLYQSVTSGFCQVQLQRANAPALMQGLDVAYPYRDRDLVAFLMAIPGEVINRDGVPKAILRDAMQGILPDGVRQRRWKADFTRAANRGIVEEYPAVLQLLTRDCLAVQAGYVDGDRLERELATVKARITQAESAVPAWQLGDLVGLELWLRRFFGGVPS